jgi:hypothetical protein
MRHTTGVTVKINVKFVEAWRECGSETAGKPRSREGGKVGGGEERRREARRRIG